jgi:hypothetical protein
MLSMGLGSRLWCLGVLRFCPSGSKIDDQVGVRESTPVKTPIFNVMSLVIPVVVAAGGYYMARTSKGATNMGEALGPYFAAAMLVMIAAFFGEVAAIVALVRGERMGWLSWIGFVVNGLLLMPAVYLLLTADWR